MREMSVRSSVRQSVCLSVCLSVDALAKAAEQIEILFVAEILDVLDGGPDFPTPTDSTRPSPNYFGYSTDRGTHVGATGPAESLRESEPGQSETGDIYT